MQLSLNVKPMHTVNVPIFELFQALSDPYRIRIIRLLLTSNDELCLCELSDCLEEPEYKLSRHLKLLKQSGFVTSQRDGKWIYHGLVKEPVYLRKLYQAIKIFPDQASFFEKDLKRYQRRLKLRKDGRCRVGVQATQKKRVLKLTSKENIAMEV